MRSNDGRVGGKQETMYGYKSSTSTVIENGQNEMMRYLQIEGD